MQLREIVLVVARRDRSGRSEGIVFKFYPKDLKDIQSNILTLVSTFGLLVFIELC